ncbi:hypothetical protein [Natronobacterium gregoryi]|uniref:Uncharacterized protein n=2 Tax=Natronobacterium gregoryi TaxID=44930 RepID=L0AL92_NATGS|nr:hypothetical protein [Natronobacterium gregoryi]AFZ74209.1 hypothetical protein Natgr_3075 [Natronobacterium gregoryi SP2]ELY63664.1 hypothetical protein C490_15479 [Natronobacterium gregoryi SP2]PLK22002.1 hypothetical protein CYV19_01000 [Natronobacterium gregoryi SP2]SFI51522.1 hypothetical protein SAMN05443661_10195 [Natronobacterium gregoryi]
MRSEQASDESFGELLDRAEDCLENVDDCLGGVDDIANLEPATIESVSGDLETLATVATETEELIDALDVNELPEAVDADELLAAIEVGEIPDVLADEDTGASDLVDFTQLFRAIDLLEAWDATDLASIWEEKRELEDAVDAVADEGEDASVLEEAAASVADEDEGLIGGDDGLLGGEGEMLEDTEPVEALGDVDVMEDPEAYQVAIQQRAMAGIDAFRWALLETHETFERLVEYNRERMRCRETSPSSRNPTAASTMPTERAAVGSGVKHATVPQDVHLSTAPSRTRIYGQRFERERENRRGKNVEREKRRSEND